MADGQEPPHSARGVATAADSDGWGRPLRTVCAIRRGGKQCIHGRASQ
jgi:hypothetical protein